MMRDVKGTTFNASAGSAERCVSGDRVRSTRWAGEKTVRLISSLVVALRFGFLNIRLRGTVRWQQEGVKSRYRLYTAGCGRLGWFSR
jgi:hypothetical protein